MKTLRELLLEAKEYDCKYCPYDEADNISTCDTIDKTPWLCPFEVDQIIDIVSGYIEGINA